MNRVRQAERRDLETLQALHRRCLRHNYAPFLGTDAVAELIGSGEADAYIEDHLKRTMVLEFDFEPTGLCVCVGPNLALLIIEPERQGRGFGTLLLDRAETYLFGLYREIRTESDARNAHGNRFLRAHGWKAARRYTERRSKRPMVRFHKLRP
ncbi:MAG: GNAT family N-acetyltransferase [Xanthomonadales bacterium]|nr:GNAT family N-acetyltransferase [Xanthomonadales bacterium]